MLANYPCKVPCDTTLTTSCSGRRPVPTCVVDPLKVPAPICSLHRPVRASPKVPTDKLARAAFQSPLLEDRRYLTCCAVLESPIRMLVRGTLTTSRVGK